MEVGLQISPEPLLIFHDNDYCLVRQKKKQKRENETDENRQKSEETLLYSSSDFCLQGLPQ